MHSFFRNRIFFWVGSLLLVQAAAPLGRAMDVKQTEVYRRIKTYLDSVPAIDTHDHLRPFEDIADRVETSRGRGMTLYSVWAHSYLSRTTRITPWPEDRSFATWWQHAQHNFDNVRATGFYRYLLPAFRDLYNVDFDTITDEEALQLNDRIFENYQDDSWVTEVVTQRANIELMFIDPFWNRLEFRRAYRFSVPVLNVTLVLRSSHPDRFPSNPDNPFTYAKQKKMKMDTFDDFLELVDVLFEEALAIDAVCLKSTQAYERGLDYERVTKEEAAKAYGKPPAETSDEEQKRFEDFMFWHVCRLSAKHELPFQIHTGNARVQGSNPILLVDAIEGNPLTKFILFHGGYPWIGETGAIAMRYKNVWIDSNWLPTIGFTMARRAYQEWLDAVPSDRIMWGADTVDAEGIYAATETTRQCLAEALAEKVIRGELKESHAVRIGRQIMRDNALKLFPKLKRMLWMSKEAPTSSIRG